MACQPVIPVCGGVPPACGPRDRGVPRGASARRGPLFFEVFLHGRVCTAGGRGGGCFAYGMPALLPFIAFSLLIYCLTSHEVRAHHLQVSRPQYSTGSFVTWCTAQSERMSSISQTSTRRSSAPPTSRRVCDIVVWGKVVGSRDAQQGCKSEHGLCAMAPVIAPTVICFSCPCSHASRSSVASPTRLKLTSPHKKAELCDSRVEF